MEGAVGEDLDQTLRIFGVVVVLRVFDVLAVEAFARSGGEKEIGVICEGLVESEVDLGEVFGDILPLVKGSKGKSISLVEIWL